MDYLSSLRVTLYSIDFYLVHLLNIDFGSTVKPRYSGTQPEIPSIKTQVVCIYIPISSHCQVDEQNELNAFSTVWLVYSRSQTSKDLQSIDATKQTIYKTEMKFSVSGKSK